MNIKAKYRCLRYEFKYNYIVLKNWNEYISNIKVCFFFFQILRKQTEIFYC